MYDMFFREWWSENYGGSESRQHRDVFKHDPPCILARRFTWQQDFAQKMLSDFFAVMLVASIWHPAGFCGESDSQSLSDCLRSPCPAVSDFYARQQVNLHSISMRDFLYQKYHKTFTLISYILSTFDRSLICFDSACQFYGASISDIIRLVPRSEISARLSSLLQNVANWREDGCRWWCIVQLSFHYLIKSEECCFD